MAFLLGTFLTGGVLGFTADRVVSRRHTTDANGTNALVDLLSKRLDLGAEQQQAIDEILDNRGVQYRRAMQTIKPQLDSIKLNAREQMRRVLTQEQKLEFETLLKEMADSTRRGRDSE